MRKIINGSLCLALASLFLTGCVKELTPKVYYDPAQTVAPELKDAPATKLDPEGGTIELSFKKADYGISCAVRYSLFVSATSDFAAAEQIAAVIGNDGSISIPHKTLNSMILNLGGEADVDYTLYFRLHSDMSNDQKTAVPGTELISNVASGVFVPYSMLVADKDVYTYVYVIGDFNAWDHGSAKMQFLYNYSKDNTSYTGVIDFGDKAANGFKLTGGADWNHGNWGLDGNAEAPGEEQGSLTLIDDGGSKDIKCYSKRFYMFSFDKNSLTLSVEKSFDLMGLIGLNGDWDNDLKMEYNPVYNRFYADVDVASDTEFKFRLDGGWDNNWGGKQFGEDFDNIPLAAGQYRIYFDLNKMSYQINKSMYGQEEPGLVPDVPEPAPTYKGWGVVGAIKSAGLNWDGDIAMTEADGVWTTYATLSAEDVFKFRKDADWVENFGAAGDVEPFVITVGTEFDAVAGGKNLAVPADGFYKLVLDTNNSKITISNGDVWGVMGDFNKWTADVFMTELEGKWVSPEIEFEAEQTFKVRKNANWDENRGGEGESVVALKVGEATKTVAGGQNFQVAEAGKYKITYDPAAETITLNHSLPQNVWSLIGQIGESNWDNDFYMTKTVEGKWLSDPLEFKAGSEFKIRFNNDWKVNRGADSPDAPTQLGAAQALKLVNDGKNLTVKEDGTYRIVYDPAKEVIFILGWGVIGVVNGTNWDNDLIMTPGEAGVWESDPFTVEGEFKIRFNADWKTNRGGEGDSNVTLTPGTPVNAVADGKNFQIENPSGKYKLSYDSAAEKITVKAAE